MLGNRERYAGAMRIGCFGLLLGLGCLPVHAEQGSEAPRVPLVIDYGDGVEKHFTQLRWEPGQTVLDVLARAEKHPRGIAVKHRGSRATAFVYQIDNVKNEGQGRNWIFSVNGKLADRSCGAWRVEAGDRIVWRFGKYE